MTKIERWKTKLAEAQADNNASRIERYSAKLKAKGVSGSKKSKKKESKKKRKLEESAEPTAKRQKTDDTPRQAARKSLNNLMSSRGGHSGRGRGGAQSHCGFTATQRITSYSTMTRGRSGRGRGGRGMSRGRGSRRGRGRGGRGGQNRCLPAGSENMEWEDMNLPKFQKDFYQEHQEVTDMTDAEVEEWRTTHEMTVTGTDIPRPIQTFEQANFPDYILRKIQEAGFEKPSPIQSQGWVMAMSGRDMIGVAETGSGKTLAFLLPAMVQIAAQPPLEPMDGPIALVVAPTRELANQIKAECDKFGDGSIRNTCVYGGAPKYGQRRDLRNGVEIVIATPGRLLDFLEYGVTNLIRVTYLVFDEADRMLDMGFEPDIRRIIGQIRPDRQIVMFSATWPKEVENLANSFFSDTSNVLKVRIGNEETSANCNVLQHVDIVSNRYQKDDKLKKILNDVLEESGKALVFIGTKRMTDTIHHDLMHQGYAAEAIHGGKQQWERDRVLANFKSGKCNVMLATDVASRGLHVNDITHVINYDYSRDVETYVHRIGRTGRAGGSGTAHTFFDKKIDGPKRARRLVKVLEDAGQTVSEELKALSSRGGGGWGSKRNSREKRYMRSW